MKKYLLILLFFLCLAQYAYAVTSVTVSNTSGDISGKAIATVNDSITDGNTTTAPSENAVFDALALKLPLAGGTLTGQIVIDETGIAGQPTDAITDCSSFAVTGGGIFYDDSEGRWKKCQDNILSDLDTSSGFSVTDITSQTDDTTPASTATAVLAQGGSLIESTLAQIGTSIGFVDWTADQGATNIHAGNVDTIGALITGYSSGAGTVAATDTILQAINKLNGNNDLKLNIANSAMTGDATLTDATPTFICNDSTNATGTCGFYANSSGGANDMIWSFGVEDSTGASTEYFQIDGVTETIDFLKPITLPNAGYIQPAATTAGHTYSFKIYDNTASAYKDALIFTNGTTGNYKVSLGAGVTLDGLGSLSLGGIVLGDTTPDADGEIGYATNAFLGFANSEDFKITASANLWTFDSNTSATFAFTPAVNFAGGLTEEGNAIYNSSETPGGELGGTWASPTIDDTGITLTSITIGSLLGVDSIDATGAVDMNYGSDDITYHTFVSDGGTTIIDGSSITTSSANDPYVFLNETDGTKWYMGVDDAGDELEFRSSATVGSGIFFKLGEGGNEMLLSTTTVSFAADADTTLYTVPTGRRCVLTKAVIVAAADAGSTDITIGQDTAESDWLPTNQLDNLDAQYDAIIVMPVPATTPTKIKSYAAATVIQINVANHAGAAGNTVYLYGILY